MTQLDSKFMTPLKKGNFLPDAGQIWYNSAILQI